MYRLSRSLATRLRRAAFPAPRPQHAVAPADPWLRFEQALSAPGDPDHVTRQRELVEENLRLTVSLVGQLGAERILRALETRDEGATPRTLAAGIVRELVYRTGGRT